MDLVFFLILGVFVVVILGGTSIMVSFAWKPLAAAFHTSGKPQGYTFKEIPAKIGSARLGVFIIVADEGLYLKGTRAPGLFTKPVLIPWSAFRPAQEKTFLMTSTLYTAIRTPEGKVVPLEFKNIELHGYLLKKLPGADSEPLAEKPPPIALPNEK